MSDIKADLDPRLTSVKESARLVELTPVNSSTFIRDDLISPYDKIRLQKKREELLGHFMTDPVEKALLEDVPPEKILEAIHEGTLEGQKRKKSVAYRFWTALQNLFKS